jgi:protein-S-isoprenylcysteine O-methyltransferase Ste14
MMRPSGARGADWILAAEVGMVLVLFALAVFLFWLPAESQTSNPSWWTWILFAILFFGVLLLDVYRRRTRTRSEIRNLGNEEISPDQD